MSISLYSYDYSKLLNLILKVCKTNNSELVEKILATGGNKVGDRYVILDCNYSSYDNNSYFNVPNALSQIFGVDDVFSKTLCMWGDEYADKKELITSVFLEHISYKLGFELSEHNIDY